MPTAVTKYINRLEVLKKQVPNITYKIVEELKDEIVHYITERQLFDKGIDGKGRRLKSYTNFTIALKKQKGEVYNRTTLLDTGDFYKGFKLNAKNYKIHITSSDDKTPLLVEKYSAEIFTLTKKHNEEVNYKLLAPKLEEWLQNQILQMLK